MRFFLTVFLCLFSTQTMATMDMTHFAKLPVLHEGRVKPLDTYARVTWQILSGKQGGADSIRWLATLVFTPEKAWDAPLIYIPNPDVQHTLSLPKKVGNLYPFRQVATALKQQKTLLKSLLEAPPEERTLAQSQLLEVHFKALWVFDLSRSLSLLAPVFALPDAGLAKQLDLPADRLFTYLDIMRVYGNYIKKVEGLDKKLPEALTEQDILLLRLGALIRQVEKDSTSRALPIIPPPPWDTDDALWRSPWATLQEGKGHSETPQYLKNWEAMSAGWVEQNPTLWSRATAKASVFMVQQSTHWQPELLAAEVFYNNFNFFQLSLWVYGFVAGLLALFFFRQYKSMLSIGKWLMVGGFFLHIVGLVLRVLILQRPPVATLYESIIFVGAVVVFLSLVLEHRRRDGQSLLLGSLAGATLHFIGLRYSAEGDSMGMLVAVLNTNFWLATHVVTITIGYGCAVMAALVAHVYLVKRAVMKQTPTATHDLLKNVLGLSLIALFFTALGTILGGIWADQSWGRFWGWDPKENGALLIVLWLAWLLHGRLSSLLSPFAFALGIAALNIIVALAWFGVNLLNVGLHSYGFTENIATNLALFCGAQGVVLGVLVLCYIRQPDCKTVT